MKVIDTNIAVDYLRGRDDAVRFLQKEKSLFITSISVAELYVGVYYSRQKEKQIHNLLNFLSGFTILDLNDESCELFGKIKADLKRKGTPIEDLDVLIAGIAMSYGFALITRNIKHFKNIEGLKIQEVL